MIAHNVLPHQTTDCARRVVSNFDLFDPVGSFADRMILLSAGWVKDPGGGDPFLYVLENR
jgi:hypothetical protein